MSSLDQRIAALAERYTELAAELLAELVRIPADHVAEDPRCGLSNHEGPRLGYLKCWLVEHGAVASPDDVYFDEFGNLVWQLEDPDDGIAVQDKKVIYLDGHTDTVQALRPQWLERLGGGVDAYDGLLDSAQLDWDYLSTQLGYLPPPAERAQLVFGRGAADQLGGVVVQAVAAKVLMELRSEGALRGVRIRSYATVAEEDNDGGGPMHLCRKVFPTLPAHELPDVVVLTEGTGDSYSGALGIYRGQRGRMQIEVEVTGRSCHGSMPKEGLNPLEFGSMILHEAAEQAKEGFKDHDFLGRGTRTASDANLDTPSDCAVPERFVFRFDRRLTAGETPAGAVAEVEGLAAVTATRAAGLSVDVRIPRYEQPTHVGYIPGNDQVYMGWVTPGEHPAIAAAVESYEAVISPPIAEMGEHPMFQPEPRVSCWIFSTDGVGFSVPTHGSGVEVPDSKRWVKDQAYMHPPMFGLGPGIEQNTHKIGECVDRRELRHAVAFVARFPTIFAKK